MTCKTEPDEKGLKENLDGITSKLPAASYSYACNTSLWQLSQKVSFCVVPLSHSFIKSLKYKKNFVSVVELWSGNASGFF